VPELPEVEAYRRLAERAVGRTVVGLGAPDPWYVKGRSGPEELAGGLVGREVAAARRVGKLLLLDTIGGPTLGLRFGMTGRLVLDGRAGVERLLYTSGRPELRWCRFWLGFAGGGRLVVQDPRRLGGVELDPDEGRLGPDAAGLGLADLRAALGASRVALKARLMDQARIAGLGNLATDEVLWRAGLDPRRPAGSLSAPESRRLHRHLHSTLAQLMERGGSHTGDLQAERRAGGLCPRDGSPLQRATVGGRTTWWCPRHQH
jgi:formamidopyrimidine-DNA glycosylase